MAQDPDELFDVVTYEGSPTGVVKRRADIHRDGDWHATIHVWVTRVIAGRPVLVFQQRSLDKDTLGGKLDATVGGHLNAGETWREAIRETEEEIGTSYAVEDLVYAGRRTAIGESEPGIRDREIQYVYFVRDERPLGDFAPNPIEVAGLAEFEIEPLLDLLSGRIPVLASRFLPVSGSSLTEMPFAIEDFAARVDRYYYRAAIAARAFLAGERHFSV